MTTEKSPFQQRVIEEKDQNDKRLEALGLFITSNPIFQTLDQEEQKRLKRQHELMTELSSVLGERIQNFKDWSQNRVIECTDCKTESKRYETLWWI